MHAAASTLAATVLLLTAPRPTPVEAKAPGVAHCYKGVCHRVRTIDQTRRLIGRTFTVATSYYDIPGVDRFNTGTFTSNGERFDAGDPARVASADLPDGTELLLRNPANGRVSHVRVNDFGPFRGNRRLDVTRRVAEDLDFKHKGVVPLDVTVIAAPTAEDLRYRRDRQRQPTLGHLGVVFDAELPALIARLAGGERVPHAAEAVIAAASRLEAAAEQTRDAIALAISSGHDEDFAPTTAPDAQLVIIAQLNAEEREPLPTSDAENAGEGAPELAVSALAQHDATDAARQDEQATAAQPIQIAEAGSAAEASTINDKSSSSSLVWGVALSTREASEDVHDAPPHAIAARAEAAPAAALDMRSWHRPPNGHFLLAAVGALAGTILVAAFTAGRNHPARAPAWPTSPRSPLRLSARRTAKPARGITRAIVSDIAAEPSAMAHKSDAGEIAHAAASPAAASSGSVLGPGLSVEGLLRSAGRVEIAGHFKGRIEAAALVVHPGGSVEGEVVCNAVEIEGALTGSIVAQRLLVRATGRVVANVETHLITIEDGAHLDASVRHLAPAPA